MIAPAAQAATGRMLTRIARALAYFGGVILAGIALMTVASITGRALVWAGLGPMADLESFRRPDPYKRPAH